MEGDAMLRLTQEGGAGGTWWRWRSEIEAVPSMSAARLPRASAVEV